MIFFTVEETRAETFSVFEDQIVVRVDVESPAPFLESDLIQKIMIKKGEPLDMNLVRESLVRFFKTGKIQDVRVKATEETGGLRITYILLPSVYIDEIHFEGNKAISSSAIREKISFHKGDTWYSEDLVLILNEIKGFYNEEGYFQASIDVIEKIDMQNQKAFLFVTIQEGGPALISGLGFHGDPRFSLLQVIKEFKTKEGKKYRASQLGVDIEKLSAWYVKEGYIKINIGDPVVLYNQNENQVEIKIPIESGPRVNIFFQGNQRFSGHELQSEILVVSEKNYEKSLLVESTERLKDFYRRNGYPFSEVSFKKETLETGDVNILFILTEKTKAVLEGIAFEGNRFFSGSELKKRLKTKESGIFSKGIFLEEQLKKDIEGILAAYRENGYIKAQAKWELNPSPGQQALFLLFVIDEGPQTLVHNIQFVGMEVFSQEAIENTIGIKKGMVFNPSHLREDLEKILSFYSQRGFVYAKIDQEIKFWDDYQKVDINYRITEEQPVYVGDIFLKGNDYTKPNVILRELLVQKGDVYDYKKILESTRRLYRLGFFNEVRFKPMESGLRTSIRDMDLVVEERYTGSLEFGGGYSERRGIVGSIQVSQDNLYGTGRRAIFRGKASLKEAEYTLSFIEPWLFDYDLSARVGLIYQIQNRTSYDLTSYGTTIGVEKNFRKGIKGFLSYQFERNQTDVESPQLIPEDEGRFNIATVNASMVWDSRDHLFNPTAGSFNGIQFREAARILGSQEQFYKITLRSNWYFKLTSWVVFAFGGNGGVANRFGSSAEVPITERFFLGGRETVRGYDQDALGPKTPDGTLAGGNVVLNLNYELRFDLPYQFGLVYFVDSGNVWKKPEDIDIKALEYSTGGGVRYFTPIGPIRLDVGFKLDPEGGEDAYKIHFTLGQIF